MAKKIAPRKSSKTNETLELDDVQASQVKGGSGLPVMYQALTKNEAFSSSTRDPASGLPVVKK